MSPTIWTQCEARRELTRLVAKPWRVVEAQHVNSTRKLCDSLEEQRILEELIDGAKRPVPQEPAFRGLDFLLFTPFRHPPLRNGSRFGRRTERGIWYGSDGQRTAFAEVAYYRFVFLSGTAAALAPITVALSAFQAHVDTVDETGVDLTRPPFDAFEPRISSPTSYDEAQALGVAMREAGVTAFRFRSARCLEDGTNVALFEPVFARKKPSLPEGWIARIEEGRVEFTPANLPSRSPFMFTRSMFEVEGVLPSPAV